MLSYRGQFTRLNLQKNRQQWPAETNHCAPYKPILLLAVIDLIAEGHIRDNPIEIIPELGELFASYWSLIRLIMPPERRMGDLALPFYHLRNDGFWHLVPRPGKEAIVEAGVAMRSISKLQETTLGARLDEDLFHLLQRDDARHEMRGVLVETYFAPVLHTPLLEQSAVNFDSYLYQRQLEQEAKSSDFQLVKPLDEEKPARKQGFRRIIVATYDHTCATCGIRILNREGHSIVVAGHIVPHHQSHNDDPHNGLALCQSCHWVFDRGLMMVGAESYRIRLSSQLKAADATPGYLADLRDAEIILPADVELCPHPLALDWHRKHVFAS
jgi:putative restriction endonuclease